MEFSWIRKGGDDGWEAEVAQRKFQVEGGDYRVARAINGGAVVEPELGSFDTDQCLEGQLLT